MTCRFASAGIIGHGRLTPLFMSQSKIDNLYSIEYDSFMFSIRRLPAFDRWFAGLRDRTTRIRLARRLERAQRGNLGDVQPVGEGVFEMREFFGPGWRLYYIERGGTVIVMLGGGDKRTQSADITAAKALAATIEERYK